MNKIGTTIVIIIAAVIAFALLTRDGERMVGNFEECVSAGYPVVESYPRQCTANGVVYKENIGNALEKENLIILHTPRPNETIFSPVEISGKARGNWYFEASFPVFLFDSNGNQIAMAVAQAQGEWMTTEFVPFSATLTFTKPNTLTGTLVLKKDNPSGLPQFEDELIVPVRF